MLDDIKPKPTNPSPRVMDVQSPASSTHPVAPDHQLTEHGTPDPAPVPAKLTAEDLLKEVAVDHHMTTSARSHAPVGLIVVTIVVLLIMVAVSWFALQKTA